MSEDETVDNVDCQEDLDDDSDDSDEMDDGRSDEIKKCEEILKSDIYRYETYVELINLLKQGDDLDKLREVREGFAKVYPLTPALWLDYINMEVDISLLTNEKTRIIELYERALKDYNSPNVWLSYCEFMFDQAKTLETIKDARTVFERALSQSGLHYQLGHRLYEKYRGFETGLMTKLEQKGGPATVKQDQRSKVRDLFRRQLSVPLLFMDETMRQYKEFMETEDCDENTNRLFMKAKKKFEEITPFEESLKSSNDLEEYFKYIDFELKGGDAARIQMIFERAIIDHCLIPSLWEKYLDYLDRILKIDSLSLPVHERSVRNCTWVAEFWASYLMCLERCDVPVERVTSVIDDALQSGFSEASDFYQILHFHASYLRRRVDFEKAEEDLVTKLREAFQQGIEQLSAFEDQKYISSFIHYWAVCEARLGNLSKARSLWEDYILFKGSATDVSSWSEYADFERRFGDDKMYRKALHRALFATNDSPEQIGERWVRFEYEEGSIETLMEAKKHYQSRMKVINERRQKRAEREAAQEEPVEQKNHKDLKNQKTQRYLKDSKNQKDSKYQKEPQRSQMEPTKRRAEAGELPPVVAKKAKADFDNDGFKVPLPKALPEPKAEHSNEHGTAHDPLKDAQTVFLSNLSYEIEEQKIRETFEDVGPIEEIRLVYDYKKRCKGFGYLVFESIHSVSEALRRDRSLIDGRPVFVTKLNERKKFDYNKAIERNKLFIKNLPNDTTKEELHELFSQHGEIKEIRFNLQRSGKFKNIAYLDYVDESSAQNAVLKLDHYSMRGREIQVAISNPPARDGKSRIIIATASHQERRPKTQLFVPRSIRKQVSTNGSDDQTTAKSNDDFRKMFLK